MSKRMRSVILPMLLLAFLLISLPTSVRAASPTGYSPFRAGAARFSVELGGGTAFGQNYTIAGIGAGYYIADGIEVGLDADEWFGNTPKIYEVSPQVRFVMSSREILKPYGGIFYSRTLIEGYRDTDTLGLRAGLFFLIGENAYFGAGLAGDRHLTCDRSVYSSCTDLYPEFLFAFVF